MKFSVWLIFTSNELKHDTEEAMQHNNIIGYINLTWYKRYSQRKKYHQAINFQTFLHHVCLLWFELRNVFPRYTWWIIDFWSHTKERYQRQIFTNTSQQTQGYLWLHVLFQVLFSFVRFPLTYSLGSQSWKSKPSSCQITLQQQWQRTRTRIVLYQCNVCLANSSRPTRAWPNSFQFWVYSVKFEWFYQ